MADDKPIIIIKKKGGHGGHHGGAWKVAYADFVTAMMAFFMVMWLVNTAETTVKQAIASYFRKPGIFESGSGTPLLIGESGILTDGYVPPHPEDTKQRYAGKSKELLLEKSGTDSATTGDKRVTYRGEEGKRDSVPDEDAAQRGFQTEESDDPQKAKELALTEHRLKQGSGDGDAKTEALIAEQKGKFEKAAEEIKEQLLTAPDLKELLGTVEVKVDSEGLNIEIVDTEKSSMFQSGSAQILPQAEEAFGKITPILATLPNKMDVIGHTDGKSFSRRIGGYSNWELSADRANAARRLLEKSGIVAERITSVAGRADKELKNTTNPLAAENRRITLRVRFDLTGTQAPTIKKRADTQATAVPQGQEPLPEVVPTRPAYESQYVEPETIKEPTRTKGGRIKLPDGVPTENPPPSRDKIFGDNPVIGPADPFANIQ